MNQDQSIPSIEVKDLLVQFEDNVVLDKLTFSITQGDYVGILGANGSGKTTLLKAMLGLLKPEAGEVKFFGTDINQSKKLHLVGYVPQRASRAEWEFPATVEEVVMSGRTAQSGFFKSLSREDKKAVKEAMKKADIVDLQHRLISRLSGGQRQRVFIARALASEPRVLILDEPTASIDAVSEHAFYDFLRELNEQGMTIILVSHDLDVITNEAKTILCVNKELVCNLPAKDFVIQHHLEDIYGEKAKHIMHRHEHDHEEKK